MTAVTARSPMARASVFDGWTRYRPLVLQLARREVAGKYRGSFFGLVWSFVHPLVMLGIYTFVFTQIFNARWVEGETTAGFALALFVGLIVHGFFAEVLSRAPAMVVGNPSYVTKIVFPLHVLPWPTVLAALFHTAASTMVLVLALAFVTGSIPVTALWFPVVLAPLALQAAGWAWLLSAISVYVRDLSQVVGLVVTALLFLSPVFFPMDTLPERLRAIARVNPLTIPIEQARNVLMWGQAPDWAELGWYSLASVLVMLAGFAAFQKLRRGFADVV